MKQTNGKDETYFHVSFQDYLKCPVSVSTRQTNRESFMKVASVSIKFYLMFIGVVYTAQSVNNDEEISLITNDQGDIVDIATPTTTASLNITTTSVGVNNVNKKNNKNKNKKNKNKKNKKTKNKKKKNKNNVDEMEKLADKLMNDFNVKFNNNNNNNNTASRSLTDKDSRQKSNEIDKKIKKWTKGVFSRPHKHHVDSAGKPVKYYKDNSIPIMFRKVLPPSGQALPLLHFKYHENGKLCKCKCKI